MNVRRELLIAFALVGTGACGAPESSDLYTGVVQQKVVSAAMAVSPAGDEFTAETATLVNQNGSVFHKVVVFNQDDPAHIHYDANHRYVFTGASFTGWSWSPSGDLSAGFTPPQKLTPPATWPILWGDPGIAQIPGTGYVFISTLAVPLSKAPPPNGSLVDDMEKTALGGACIARSTNGGQTFSVSANDCLHDSLYSFYDGSEIVGTPSGAVYAAFDNVATGHIDVWRAPTATAPFVLLPNPFVTSTGPLGMTGHARMHALFDSVAIVSPSGSQLWLAIYDPGAGWRPTSAGFPRLVASDYNSTDISIGGIPIRRGGGNGSALPGGAQFGVSWSIQYGSPGISDLWVPYTAMPAGHSIIKAGYCAIYGTPVPCSAGGTVDPGANVFHPAIETTRVTLPPSPSYDVVTVLTWLQQVNTNQVVVMSASLNGGSITGRTETGPQAVCSDMRGFWGDYDNHLGVYQATPSLRPLFWRSFTDSTNSAGASTCYERWRYQAGDVDVSTTWMSY